MTGDMELAGQAVPGQLLLDPGVDRRGLGVVGEGVDRLGVDLPERLDGLADPARHRVGSQTVSPVNRPDSSLTRRAGAAFARCVLSRCRSPLPMVVALSVE